MAYFEKIVHGLSRWLDIIARYALLAMVAIAVANMILRRIWLPILGTYEFIGFLMVIVTGFALANCAAEKGHIFVGFILDRFEPRVQAIVDVITGFIAAALFGIVTWQCIVYANMIWQTGQLSPTLHLAYHPLIYALAACFLLLALVLVIDLINSILKAAKG